jgi:hypothetical protein
MRKPLTIFLFLLMTSMFSCMPAQIEATPEKELNINNPYGPQENDSSLTRGKAYVDSIVWLADGQELKITGNLPTPCHELRVDVSQNDNELALDVYSVTSTDQVCAEVLEPFTASLIIENFSKEEYALTVNGSAMKY